MINSWKSYFRSLGFKVALTITLLVAGLFVLLNFVVIDRGQQTFADVYDRLRERGELPPIDAPFMMRGHGFRFFMPTPVEEIEQSAQEFFTDQFQSSLLIVGLVALFAAIGIGALISRLISRPLEKLTGGLKRLRETHYQSRLPAEGSEEFKALVGEFNALATELQRTERLRQNLISDTSHELKTPLTTLKAQLEGAADGVISMDAERVKLLRTQVDRLSDLVEGLQEYAQLRSQSVTPRRTTVKVRELLDALIAERQGILAEHHLDVVQRVPNGYEVLADREMLTRLFSNLLENAIRYSQASEIIMSASEREILIRDNGVGIPAEHQRDIFERFFRLEKSRHRSTGGLGLGLAIVKEIVEAHGWTIVAKTPEEGKGVEFVITLASQ